MNKEWLVKAVIIFLKFLIEILGIPKSEAFSRASSKFGVSTDFIKDIYNKHS